MTISKDTTNLLSICCSFRRPSLLKDMIKTFYETRSERTDLFIYLHSDDPFLADYLPIVQGCNYVIDTHRSLCKTINHVVFDLFPEIKYYQTIVDDHRYRTLNWDKRLIEELNKVNDLGSASPKTISDENWNIWQHPSAEVYSWKFVSTLGYVYPPEFDGFGADFYLKNISKAVNGLVYVPDVHIEHLWWSGCGKPADQNIQEGYSGNNQTHGVNTYNNWVARDRAAAISKFKV